MAKRMDAHSLVRLLEEVDNHMHHLEAKRAIQGEKTRMPFRKWERMLHGLLEYAGTPRAKKLIEWSKD